MTPPLRWVPIVELQILGSEPPLKAEDPRATRQAAALGAAASRSSAASRFKHRTFHERTPVRSIGGATLTKVQVHPGAPSWPQHEDLPGQRVAAGFLAPTGDCNPLTPPSKWFGSRAGCGLIACSLGQLREAVGPDVDGVHNERVRPGIELVSSDEKMERAHRDALDRQAATTAMLWQRLPDATSGKKGERRRQIVAPEEPRLVSVELNRDVVIDRRSYPNSSPHLPSARRRRCSRSSSGTRLIVSDERLESDTTRSRSAERSTSSTPGSAGRGLPRRSPASDVAGFAMPITVADATDNGPQPTTLR